MSKQSWHRLLRGNPIDWLLEEENPSVRAFALTDILGEPQDSPEVRRARKAIAEWGLVMQALALQTPGGYWGDRIDKPYGARRTSAYFTLLADVGLERNEGIDRAADYLFQRSQSIKDSGFAIEVKQRSVYCLTGYLVRSLLRFGFSGDPRLDRAIDSLVRTAEEPTLLDCVANQKKPCQWGMVKMLSAFAEIPEAERSPRVKGAISELAGQLLDYPFDFQGREKRWLSFGFPYQYQSDLLDMLMVLAKLAYGKDSRFRAYAEIVLSMQDAKGRWVKRAGSRIVDVGKNGQPNKWITLSALRVAKAISD
ncbi:MAG: hypothetical protein MUP14_07460 [Dehalococcoidia bacterium]|nr:hypothetical protein [Dehalococcoidia bacterium]